MLDNIFINEPTPPDTYLVLVLFWNATLFDSGCFIVHLTLVSGLAAQVNWEQNKLYFCCSAHQYTYKSDLCLGFFFY